MEASAKKKNEALVVKSNQLIEAHYRLTASEQKIILTVVSMIQKDDKAFRDYVMSVNLYKEIMGVKGKSYHTRLRQKSKALMKKPLVLIHKNGDETILNWFSRIKYLKTEGKVVLNFHPDLKPYLLNFKNRFTKYQLHNATKLRSAYAIRLYELLKQFESLGERVFDLEDLRLKVGVENGRLAKYGSFKQRVLEPSKKELSEKTDINFSYEPIKEIRTVKAVKFIIHSKFDERKKHEKSINNDCKKTVDLLKIAEIPDEIKKYIPKEYENHKGIKNDIIKFLNLKSYDYVLQKVVYTLKHRPKKFPSYLGKALLEDYGADFNPLQKELFPESSNESKCIVSEGMKLSYKKKTYTVDQALCIWPEGGGCLATGMIIKLINSGVIKIIEE